MMELVSAHAGALAMVAAALVLSAAIALRSESLPLWLLSTWHSVPWVGGIAALARRQKNRRSSSGASTAVMALCSSYGRFIRVLSRSDYDNYMSYLRKAGDLGREPFPAYLRVVIFSMVLIEAAGLAYVLAGWTLPGASEFAQRVAALGIGFLIAVVLVFFTHWSGLEIDQVNRYRRDYNEWLAAGKVGPLFGPDLSLNDAQNVDDKEPAYRQRATRGHGKTRYVMTTITLLMVVAVGTGAAYVRGQVLEQEIVNESSARARSSQRFDLGTAEAGRAESRDLESRMAQEEVSIKRRGGWGTLIILGIIFFFLQILSIFFGFRHSFNGRLSKEAYRALRVDSFSSYNELTQYYDRIADIAQGKVDRLQQLLEQGSRNGLGEGSAATPYSFRDYLQARDVQRRDKPLGAADPDAAALAPERTPAGPAAAPAGGHGAVAGPVAITLPAARPRAAAAPPAVPIFGSIPLAAEDAAPVALDDPRAAAQARLDLAEKLEREKAARARFARKSDSPSEEAHFRNGVGGRRRIMMRPVRVLAGLICASLAFCAAPAFAAGRPAAARENAIPSCYDQLREYAPGAALGDLTIVIDQTTYLDARLRDIVQETVLRLVQPGTRVSIATFSAFLQGRYLDVPMSGQVEAPVPAAQRDFVSKRELRQNDACLDDQLVFARRLVARSLGAAFAGIDANVERSDILAALRDLSRRVGDARGASRMVVVVSDMLENSSISSFYQSNRLRGIDPELELRKASGAGIKADFHGARVVVIGAGGVSSAPGGLSYRDPRALLALETFWRGWFSASGAELVEFGKPTPLIDIHWDNPALAASASN